MSQSELSIVSPDLRQLIVMLLHNMVISPQLEEQLAQQESELDEFRMLEQAAANKSMNTLLGLINPGGSYSYFSSGR